MATSDKTPNASPEAEPHLDLNRLPGRVCKFIEQNFTPQNPLPSRLGEGRKKRKKLRAIPKLSLVQHLERCQSSFDLIGWNLSGSQSGIRDTSSSPGQVSAKVAGLA
jgi:hypothetical protein